MYKIPLSFTPIADALTVYTTRNMYRAYTHTHGIMHGKLTKQTRQNTIYKCE